MTISDHKHNQADQGILWPDLHNVEVNAARARNVCGDFFEMAAVELTGAQRHRTDGTVDYCPDLSLGSDFIESKSVGSTRSCLIYLRRLAKDRRMERKSGHPLHYAFFQHYAKVGRGVMLHELHAALAASVVSVTVIPLCLLRDIVRDKKAKQVLQKHASSTTQKNYGRGWTIPLNVVQSVCTLRIPHIPLTVCGFRTCDFPVYTLPCCIHLFKNWRLA